MIRNIPEALFTNDDILFFDEDFGNVTFFANQMVKYSQQRLIKTLKTNLNDADFYEYDLETIIHARFLLTIINLKTQSMYERSIPAGAFPRVT